MKTELSVEAEIDETVDDIVAILGGSGITKEQITLAVRDPSTHKVVYGNRNHRVDIHNMMSELYWLRYSKEKDVIAGAEYDYMWKHSPIAFAIAGWDYDELGGCFRRRITEHTPEIMAEFEDAQEDRPMIEPISNNWMEDQQ